MKNKYIHVDTLTMRGILAGTRTQVIYAKSVVDKATEAYKYAAGDDVLVKEEWRVIYVPGRFTLPEKEGIIYRADNKFNSVCSKRYWQTDTSWREARRLPTNFVRMKLHILDVEELKIGHVTKRHIEANGFSRRDRVLQFIRYWDATNRMEHAYTRDPVIIAYTFEAFEV